jgi:hypothetical protein
LADFRETNLFPGSFRENMLMTGAKAHGTLEIFSVFAKNLIIFATEIVGQFPKIFSRK